MPLPRSCSSWSDSEGAFHRRTAISEGCKRDAGVLNDYYFCRYLLVLCRTADVEAQADNFEAHMRTLVRV